MKRHSTPLVSAGAAPGAVRLGVDLVVVSDVADSIARFGRQYLARLFSQREIEETEGPFQERALAARFAVKEAAIKALGPVDKGPGWRSIEVGREPGGAPKLILHNEAAAMASSAGLEAWSVSLSHEGPVAVAVVVAQGVRGGSWTV